MADAYQVVRDFEQAVADFAGAKHGVATDSCSSAILLSLLHQGESLWPGKSKYSVVRVPKRTYPSVPMAVVHAGCRIRWTDEDWHGTYWLDPLRVVDGAKRFCRGMYTTYTLHCLSFHAKKLLPIGRGGMVLTDDAGAAAWLRRARFDGRDEVPLSEQRPSDVLGYNCYMTPEQAARGLMLLRCYKDQPDQTEDPPYPDLSTWPCFKEYTA